MNFLRKLRLPFLVILFFAVFLSSVAADPKENIVNAKICNPSTPFMIKVVDSQTGRGIPLVELRTTNDILYYTDSAGIVAFNELGLMNKDVFFFLSSHGYEFPQDFFGNRGQTVSVAPCGSVTFQMTRKNIAERLYRVTGQGIYRDSYLLGLTTPIQNPLLNGQVMGQDSVQTIKYRNKLYWFWGDTNRPSYPLGNFKTTGATSDLPGLGGLNPSVGVNLTYFTNPDGFVKSMVPPLPDGGGLIWVFGLMTAKDETGKERLLTGYSSLNPALVGRGILIFNDNTEQFEQLVAFPSPDDWRHPGGQAVYYEDQGTGYWLFTEHQFPNLRVPATIAAIKDPNQYESFTSLMPGTKYNGAATLLERDQNGKLVWGWKLNTPPLTQDQEKELKNLGLITLLDSTYFQLKDTDAGNDVLIAASSIEWNEYRHKWIMIGQQKFGTSLLGETWYAEAPSPEGPWKVAKKIVTHDNYTFYNPALHPFFDQDGGRVIYFEATYTASYTNHVPTPYYNYNQVMYKLSLDDPRLSLPPAD